MRRPSRVLLVTVAVLLAAAAFLGVVGVRAVLSRHAEIDRLRDEAAASAARAAAVWAEPAVQERWATALVAPMSLTEWPGNGLDGATSDGLRRGAVGANPSIGNDPGHGVIAYSTATDQDVETMGAMSTLQAVADPESEPCEPAESCEPIKALRATSTIMGALTARGAASVPAWLYEVDGPTSPVLLPAVPISSPADIAPGHGASYWASLVTRDGSALTVDLVTPYCGSRHQPHVLETDAVVVVWATGTPSEEECAVPVTRTVTFTLATPIGDRPVVDHLGDVVMPAAVWRLTLPVVVGPQTRAD